MESRYYQVNGITLHCWEAGEGNSDAVIFLHGFPEYGAVWEPYIHFMAARGYHVLAPDQRGYNLSAKPQSVKAYELDALVDDILALMDLRSSGEVVLVGHDWGGGVAWRLAARYPERLKELVILNMPHPAVMVKTLFRSPLQLLKSWYQVFFQLRLLPEKLLRAFNFKCLGAMMSGTARKGTFDEQQLDHYKTAWRQPGALTAMINWYRAYKYDAQEPPRIRVPVLVIWGKNDRFLNTSMARRSVERCRDGQLIILDNTGHWLHHEEMEQVRRLIMDFIS